MKRNWLLKLSAVMSKSALLAFTLSLFFSTNAYATDVGFYITPKVTWSLLLTNSIEESYYSSEIGSYSESGGSGDNESTFGGGIALGYDFMPQTFVPVRVELEYMARSESEYSASYDWGGVLQKSKAKVNVQTLFINMYTDWYTGTPFIPYIGCGVGLAFAKSKLNDSATIPGVYGISGSNSETTTNFAWNVGAGAAWAFTDNIALDIGYRYAYFGKVKATAKTNDPIFGKVSSKYKADLSAHEVMLGLRIGF